MTSYSKRYRFITVTLVFLLAKTGPAGKAIVQLAGPDTQSAGWSDPLHKAQKVPTFALCLKMVDV